MQARDGSEASNVWVIALKLPAASAKFLCRPAVGSASLCARARHERPHTRIKCMYKSKEKNKLEKQLVQIEMDWIVGDTW